MRTEAYAVECTGKARDSRKSRRMGKLMCRNRSITTKRAQKTGDDSKRNDTNSRDTQTEEESKGGVKRPDGKIIRIRRTTTGKDSTADRDDYSGKTQTKATGTRQSSTIGQTTRLKVKAQEMDNIARIRKKPKKEKIETR